MTMDKINKLRTQVLLDIQLHLCDMPPEEMMVLGSALLGLDHEATNELYRELGEPEPDFNSIEFALLETLYKSQGKKGLLEAVAFLPDKPEQEPAVADSKP